MARTVQTKAKPAVDSNAAPKPIDINGEPFARLYNLVAAYKILDEDNLLLVPNARFKYDADLSPAALWRNDEDGAHNAVLQAAETWEKLQPGLSEMPRIVQYRGRDRATGFAIIENTGGLPLSESLTKNDNTIYSGSDRQVSPAYTRTFYRYAINILAALQFLHEHGFLCLNIADRESFWLREDGSLALVGLMGAYNTATAGSRHYCGNAWSSLSLYQNENVTDRARTVKTDLFDWATLVYELMTGSSPDVETIIRGELPPLEDEKLGSFVHKCWKKGYDDAAAVLSDVRAYLQTLSIETTNDDLVMTNTVELPLR